MGKSQNMKKLWNNPNHYYNSEDYRNKMSKSLKNRKLSEEHKRNIKENHWSKKGYKAWNKNLNKENDERIKKASIKSKITRNSEIWKKSKARKNISDSLKERRKYQILPLKDTSIEIKIQNFLKELNIEFYPHQYIYSIEHNYQCDIFIPSMKLIIECDGDYWHHFPIGNDIDRIRTKELINYGFKVLRLWEHEIRKLDLISFKDKLCKI